jgi:hypothetical protein
LGSRRFDSNNEAEMAVGQRFEMPRPDFHHKEIIKIVSKWDKCISVMGNYAEK